MLRNYEDIRSRLGRPLWWDDNGVPRYDGFEPRMCGVYDKRIAFLRISCQRCVARFKVAVAESSIDRAFAPSAHPPAPPSPDDMRYWHYGDPPSHGCIGDTMNSIPEAVLEFWDREDFQWVRRPEHEFELG